MQAETDYTVGWRFISLYVLNEDKEPSEEMRAGPRRPGCAALRVADQVRIDHGNDAVAAFYTALGTRIHVERRRDELVGDAGGVRRRGADDGRARPGARRARRRRVATTPCLRAEVELALSRTGPDVGTPILTFAPGQGEREGSFFGPVISKAPRGAEAVKLWDAVETLATSGVAELKRSLRAKPDFTLTHPSVRCIGVSAARATPDREHSDGQSR